MKNSSETFIYVAQRCRTERVSAGRRCRVNKKIAQTQTGEQNNSADNIFRAMFCMNNRSIVREPRICRPPRRFVSSSRNPHASRFTLVSSRDPLSIMNRKAGYRRSLPTLLDCTVSLSLRSSERMAHSFPQVQVNNHLVPSARPVIVINRNLFKRIPQPRGGVARC